MLIATLSVLCPQRALADTADAAAAKYSIKVFISEPKDGCFSSGSVAAKK